MSALSLSGVCSMRKSDELIDMCIAVEDARDALKAMHLGQMKGIDVGVTEPLACAIVNLDRTLQGLNYLVGSAILSERKAS